MIQVDLNHLSHSCFLVNLGCPFYDYAKFKASCWLLFLGSLLRICS